MATGKPLILDIYNTGKHGTFGASIMEQLAIILMIANKASVRCLSSVAQAGETSTMFDEEMIMLGSAAQVSMLLPNAHRPNNTTDAETQVPVGLCMAD